MYDQAGHTTPYDWRRVVASDRRARRAVVAAGMGYGPPPGVGRRSIARVGRSGSTAAELYEFGRAGVLLSAGILTRLRRSSPGR